jgi:hypothetical protein
MIPRESIDVLRNQVEVTLANYGIDCTLYIPTNTSWDSAKRKDVFETPSDYEYVSYSAKVFIEWGVSVNRLKKLGVFVEGMLPILAWFGNRATAIDGSDAGIEVDIDIIIQSYFTIEPEFIPSNYQGLEAFEIVNQTVKAIHDAEIFRGFSIAPRRIKKGE